MAKNRQNLVVFIQPPTSTCEIGRKGSNMLLNRFCIEEDAAFELSGVHHMDKSFTDMKWHIMPIKGKEFLCENRCFCQLLFV